jgi:hypothetical protein
MGKPEVMIVPVVAAPLIEDTLVVQGDFTAAALDIVVLELMAFHTALFALFGPERHANFLQLT